MRRTTRTFAGALLAAGLGLSGCAFGGDEADLDGTGIPPVFQEEEEEVGEPDQVDDDEVGLEGDDSDTVDDGETTDGETTDDETTDGDTGPDSGPDIVEDDVVP